MPRWVLGGAMMSGEGPVLRDRMAVVVCVWGRGGVRCSGCCGVGHLPSLAAHSLTRLPGPPPHRNDLLLG